MIGSSQSDLQVQYSTTVDSKATIGDPLYYNNKDNYVDADKISDWSTVKNASYQREGYGHRNTK
mgnify:CR=1 FL=1